MFCMYLCVCMYICLYTHMHIYVCILYTHTYILYVKLDVVCSSGYRGRIRQDSKYQQRRSHAGK